VIELPQLDFLRWVWYQIYWYWFKSWISTAVRGELERLAPVISEGSNPSRPCDREGDSLWQRSLSQCSDFLLHYIQGCKLSSIYRNSGIFQCGFPICKIKKKKIDPPESFKPTYKAIIYLQMPWKSIWNLYIISQMLAFRGAFMTLFSGFACLRISCLISGKFVVVNRDCHFCLSTRGHQVSSNDITIEHTAPHFWNSL
jgi:hypothetical protein